MGGRSDRELHGCTSREGKGCEVLRLRASLVSRSCVPCFVYLHGLVQSDPTPCLSLLLAAWPPPDWLCVDAALCRCLSGLLPR